MMPEGAGAGLACKSPGSAGRHIAARHCCRCHVPVTLRRALPCDSEWNGSEKSGFSRLCRSARPA